MKFPSEEEINKAAKEWATRMSKAPDAETPEWRRCLG